MKLIHNAKIYTMNPAQPRVDALLIANGRILACGEKDQLAAIARGKLETFDLQGKTILPGLTDAHLHIQYYALGLDYVDCETSTQTECLRRVMERVKHLQPGEWLLGHGWNQNQWQSGFPTAQALDAVAPNNPVYLTAKSLHAGWANTAALKLANITDATPDPKDGVIQRDAAGRATGALLETAMGLVGNIIPAPTLEQLAQKIEKAQQALWQMGITGIHDFDRREAFMALQYLHAQGKLKLRVNKNIPVESLDHAAALGLRTGFGDDMLWVGSVKAFMDGALGPQTAAMFAPYEGSAENKGILNMDGEELFEIARKAAETGLSMTVHAIGDRANHEVLNAYAQLRNYEKERGLPRLRHRIEHVQVLHPNDVPRLAQLDVIASMQPIHATSDMHMADQYWGARSELAYAWRAQLASGATLAFGSDAPVESPNPFWGLHAAVTRQRAGSDPASAGWYPGQALSLSEALSAYTYGAAYAANAEQRLGKLAENYHADLIALTEDPFELPASDLSALKPAAVMLAGEWVLQ